MFISSRTIVIQKVTNLSVLRGQGERSRCQGDSLSPGSLRNMESWKEKNVNSQKKMWVKNMTWYKRTRSTPKRSDATFANLLLNTISWTIGFSDHKLWDRTNGFCVPSEHNHEKFERVWFLDKRREKIERKSNIPNEETIVCAEEIRWEAKRKWDLKWK